MKIVYVFRYVFKNYDLEFKSSLKCVLGVDPCIWTWCQPVQHTWVQCICSATCTMHTCLDHLMGIILLSTTLEALYITRPLFSQVLNLAWCGGGGIMSQSSLVNFMEKCGSNALTHLTFASSPTVSDDALQRIVTYCPSLVHLNLQSCNSLTPEGLRRLHHLTKLTYLNLYRTKVWWSLWYDMFPWFSISTLRLSRLMTPVSSAPYIPIRRCITWILVAVRRLQTMTGDV